MRGNVHVRFGGRGWKDLRLKRPQGVPPSTQHLPLDQSSANWIFQVVSRRYEKSSPIVLTSNRGFSDWGQVFADQVVASAIVDRLIHDAVVVNIRGRSYRMRAHQDAPLTLAAAPGDGRRKGGD